MVLSATTISLYLSYGTRVHNSLRLQSMLDCISRMLIFRSCSFSKKTIFSISIQEGTAHAMFLGCFMYWSTLPKEEINQNILR